MNRVLFAFFVFSAVFAFSAQAEDINVDKGELNKARRDIDFENNSQTPEYVNSLSQIRGIGADLARLMLDNKGNIKRNVRVGDKSRYSMMQVAEPPAQSQNAAASGAPVMLDADIIELGKYAGVDTIRNLRQIIAGYLETLYKYSKQEADELAICITVYNAVYRNDIDIFKASYGADVVSQLNADKVGLSPSWKEWAGDTQIVIPIKLVGLTPEVAVEAVLTDKVLESISKERISIDTKQIVREQQEREEAAKKEAREQQEREDAARAKAEREKLELEIAKTKARRAKEEADERLAHLQRAIDSAIEKEQIESARIARLKDEEVSQRQNLEKARQNVVVNKFGKPIAGNETALELEKDLKRHQDLIKQSEKAQVNLQKEIETLRKNLEEAKLDAENKKNNLL